MSSTPHRREWLAPLLAGARSRDRLLGAAGGTLAVALTTLVSALLAPGHALPFIAASLGSSTVLLFVVPASPMSSPWAIVGGSTVSAFSGALFVHLLGATALSAGLAVGGAILGMSALRCLHPPGGGYALVAPVAGAGAQAAGWSFVLLPIAIDAAILVLCGLVFHRLISGHSYPHRPKPVAHHRFEPADIDAALDELGEAFDVAREDLDALLEAAERHARKRRAA